MKCGMQTNRTSSTRRERVYTCMQRIWSTTYEVVLLQCTILSEQGLPPLCLTCQYEIWDAAWIGLAPDVQLLNSRLKSIGFPPKSTMVADLPLTKLLCALDVMKYGLQRSKDYWRAPAVNACGFILAFDASELIHLNIWSTTTELHLKYKSKDFLLCVCA